MNTVLKTAFAHLLQGDIAAWEAEICERWGHQYNPTARDGRVNPETGFHLLQDASDRRMNSVLRYLYSGTSFEAVEPPIATALTYLRWVQEGQLTDEGRRKALSLMPLKTQCEILHLGIEALAAQPNTEGAKNAERAVAERLAPSGSQLVYAPQRILSILRTMVTSATVDKLGESPIEPSLRSRLQDQSGMHLDIDVLSQSRGTLPLHVDNLSKRLDIKPSRVWELSDEIRTWQIDIVDEVGSSLESLMWHFDHNHFGLATNILNDEVECRRQIEALWTAIESDGVKRVIRSLLRGEILGVGWPDLTFCLRGELRLLEVKRGRDRLSFSQVAQIEALRTTLGDLITDIRVAYLD